MGIQAQIYLADQRGCFQTNDVRSYHCFNSGHYAAESRQPFGALYQLNDTTLRAGASLTTLVEQVTDVVLIPLMGGLAYQNGAATGFLEPGQVLHLSLDAGTSYTVSNPYERVFVNLIDIWLTEQTGNNAPTANRMTFDLSQKNRLLPLFNLVSSDAGWRGSGLIGQYGGRRKDAYPLSIPRVNGVDSRIFIFCVQGSFEVQDRLLHEKDGLALQNPTKGVVELEALSPDAMLILLEIPDGRPGQVAYQITG